MRRARAYLLSIGSNVESDRWIPEAIRRARARFTVEAVSAAYGSKAVGPAGQPPFVNRALRMRTDLPPAALRAVCRHVEWICGRVRGDDRFAPRTLDLDVVYDGVAARVLDPDLLAQPHVLVPCAEVWPDARVDGRTLADVAADRCAGWAEAHRLEDA